MKYTIYYYEDCAFTPSEIIDFGENNLETNELMDVVEFFNERKKEIPKTYESLSELQKKQLGGIVFFESIYIDFWYVRVENKIYHLESYISKIIK